MGVGVPWPRATGRGSGSRQAARRGGDLVALAAPPVTGWGSGRGESWRDSVLGLRSRAFQPSGAVHSVLVCGTSPHHFGITRPRRYPIQQGRYSCVLATLCRNGGHRKRVLSRGSSRVVCRPSTVRIAPPGSNLARFPIAAQIPKAPDPWSKEAVLLALERWKRKKRTVEEEEDQISAAGQEDKRRCHDSSGSGHSAFKPEVANGVPAAFVPEPGPLKRGLSSPSSDGELRKRTCTPAVSCSKGTCTCGIRMSRRNAITSSYTSTGGISQLWKRCPSASPFSSPASSLSQTRESPEKKMREEDGPQGSGSSAPPVNKESQGEQGKLMNESMC
ncbi:nuclear envelope pore membrane protein POM 121-like [Manis pentadactyla]|uniref:nuclear envelope pore membrane protein POM 121-like n=1 Tax=Manis pentadactyla TaxID=143292 RepID=UPI00255C36BE|nr:nuclear envelope pore membrane protein POM 121-like [Manis pentadactyla]